MDRIYFDGQNGLSYIDIDETSLQNEENWELWYEFSNKHFHLFQYKEEEVINQWGVSPDKFIHDEDMQKLYDDMSKKFFL